MEAAEQLGYRVNRIASGLRGGSSRQLGLVMTNLVNASFHTVTTKARSGCVEDRPSGGRVRDRRDRKGLVRARPASGPQLAVLAPLDPAGYARPRLPHRPVRHSPGRRALHRADCLDPQRNPAPFHHTGTHPDPHPRPPAELVTLAPPTPIPRPTQPLPATIPTHTMITKSGWSTRPRLMQAIAEHAGHADVYFVRNRAAVRRLLNSVNAAAAVT
jgi:hypothetical protein